MAVVLLMVRLLNVIGFEPPIVCAALPFIITVLVEGVNVPLLEKFPFMVWLNEPALKVVPDPMVKAPSTVSASPAVTAAVPDMEKFPAMAMAVACNALAPLPLMSK